MVTRGPTCAHVRIYFTRLDASAVPLDAAGGKEVWKVKLGSIYGETMAAAADYPAPGCSGPDARWLRTMRTLAAAVLAMLPGVALAHGEGSLTIGELPWTFDPWVIGPLGVSAVLYFIGSHRLWRRTERGRGVRLRQAGCFWTGWVLLALALVSPLHWLGERLFVAHMLEHEIVMVAAAPLLALARPLGAFFWALPQRWRRLLGRFAHTRALSAAWSKLTDPLVATMLHGAALWAWHMPVLYNAVLVQPLLHRLQHASLLLSALLFWWAMFRGGARAGRFGAAVLYLFATSLHSGALGALLTLSRQLWYPRQAEFAVHWGLTPLEDQQLAGLIMWVPAGMVYALVALALAGRWITDSGVSARATADRAPSVG